MPYFEILEKWIYKGVIVDPYSEVRHSYWREFAAVHSQSIQFIVLINTVALCYLFKIFIFCLFHQFLVEEHSALRKEKLQQDYNDAYPLSAFLEIPPPPNYCGHCTAKSNK